MKKNIKKKEAFEGELASEKERERGYELGRRESEV